MVDSYAHFNARLIEQVMDALHFFRSTHSSEPISMIHNDEYPDIKDLKQFVIAIKPELLTEGVVRIEEALQVVLRVLHKNGIIVGSVSLLPSKYLKEKRVIEKYYYLLNQISLHGTRVMSSTNLRVLMESFSQDIPEDACILGGHELLMLDKRLSAVGLDIMSQNGEVKKIFPGIYAIKLVVDNHSYIVLNPFHPRQLDWFQKDYNAVLSMECFSTREIADVRSNVIGSLEPSNSPLGSIRRILYDNRKELKLPECTMGFNGIHASPGLIEAMANVYSCFYKTEEKFDLEDTLLGSHLRRMGISRDFLRHISTNPAIINSMKSQPYEFAPLFALTEEMSLSNVKKLISKTFLQRK